MTVRQTFLALTGLLLLGTAPVLAAWLNTSSSWWGFVGFSGVLGVPGLMALAGASRRVPPRLVLPLLPLTVSLLGIDVTDSARVEIVVAGYLWFAVLMSAAVLAGAWAFRPGGTSATTA